MSDQDEWRKEKDYWGDVRTPNPGRSADKTGWGERKEAVTPARQSWGGGGGTPDDLSKASADKWSSANAPTSRHGLHGVARESVSQELSGARLFSSSSPSPAHTAHISPLMIAGVASVVLLLFAVLTNTGRRRADTPGAGTTATTASPTTTAFVNTKELNVRAGPGREYSVVTKIAHGDEVMRIETGQSTEGTPWARIRFGSVEGWVNRKFLSESKPPPLVEEMPVGGDAAGGSFNDAVFSMGSVGGTQIVGMTVAEASKALGVRLIREGDESEGCFYVKPEGGVGLFFMVNDGTIARFDIGSNSVQYEGWIRVGDSEAKLRSAFGERLIVEPHAYDEQGKYFKVTRGGFGVVFETDGKSITSIRSGRSPEFEYVEGCS